MGVRGLRLRCHQHLIVASGGLSGGDNEVEGVRERVAVGGGGGGLAVRAKAVDEKAEVRRGEWGGWVCVGGGGEEEFVHVGGHHRRPRA
jgi:hypothetical protein